MNSEQFIEKIKTNVRDAAKEDLINKLQKPPGRKPRPKHLIQSQWYNQLKSEDKNIISQIIEEAIDEALFGFLAVIDGVRVIEEPQDRGRLELKHINGEEEQLLNNPNKEYLHDIFNGLVSQE